MLATSEVELDSIVDGNAADVDAIFRALPDVLAFGDQKVVNIAGGLGAAWEQWLYEATPLSGTQCWPSSWQRHAALEAASSSLTMFALHVRRSLGRVPLRLRLRLLQTARTTYRVDHPVASMDDPNAARACLINWRVRDCRGSIPDIESGYNTSDTPWASLDVTHVNYFQPLAAFALKRPEHPWTFAVESRLPSETINELELDAVRLITGNTGAWSMKLRGKNWVPGESEGDRAYLWMMSDLEQQNMQTTLANVPDDHCADDEAGNAVPLFVAHSPEEVASWIITTFGDQSRNETP